MVADLWQEIAKLVVASKRALLLFSSNAKIECRIQILTLSLKTHFILALLENNRIAVFEANHLSDLLIQGLKF